MPAVSEVVARALRSLVPPPRLRASEWIEREIRLPSDVSSLPGPIALWPPQVGIADAIGDPDLERVSVVKPVRVGFTTLLTATLASYVANDPAMVLVVLPTDDDCRAYMVSDVEPIFEASPVVAGALGDDRPEGERNTILSKRFPGGSLRVRAARSPRNLRALNARVLLMDEVDGMEVTREGDPILLAERRTFNAPDRKIVKGSTPVMGEEASPILRAYAQSDRRVFELPCPECGEFFELMWEHIRWDKAEDGTHRPETAYCGCPCCGAVIEEARKPAMVMGGRWRATRPEVAGHAGFRLNALVSLQKNAAWGVLVAEWLAAKDDPTTLQTFVNTILGQGWKGEGEELDEGSLLSRREPWGLEAVPADVLAVTLGVDVQDDRLECTALGWTDAGRMMVLGHHVIDGRYDEDETWAELDAFLGRRLPHALGGTVGFDAAAVDSGSGLHSPYVTAFCRARALRRVMAIKGEDGFKRPIIERSKTKNGLWIVGADAAKQRLFLLLPDVAAVTFSADLPEWWFEQLTSERRVVRYVRQRPVARFERVPGRRAEALDCMVYAMAAKQALGAVDWNQRRAEASVAEPATVRTSRPRRDAPGQGVRGLNLRF